MRGLMICSVVLALATSPVAADCSSEITALFYGGAWDPFHRENRRETTVLLHPDGSKTPSSDVLWDGPIRSINCTPINCFMAVGSTGYTGATFEGPWKASGDNGIADPEAFVRGTTKRLATSVSEAECLGTADFEGQSALHYRFYSKPEPNEYGSWWGGRYSVWVNPKSKRILRYELAEGVASWAPKVSSDVQVTTIVYDETIKVEAPK